MKAVVITRPGGPEVLQFREVEEPRPKEGELLVKVFATALNRADVLQRKGRYPAPAGVRDDIPGLEFSGIVEKCGAAVTLFRPGDRVMGLLAGEAYAEKIVVPALHALKVPPGITLDQASAIPEVFLTAYDALFLQAKLALGEKVLIHAAGSGVGTAALQLARQSGAVVLGTAGSPEKLARAEELGLAIGIDYKKSRFDEVVLSKTEGKGVEVILDLVGASFWEQNLSCLASTGRLILVGLLGGSRIRMDLGALAAKRQRILGTVLRHRSRLEKAGLMGSFRAHVLPLLEAGAIRPVVDRVFPWSEVAQAHAWMENNRNFGKVVLQIEAE